MLLTCRGGIIMVDHPIIVILGGPVIILYGISSRVYILSQGSELECLSMVMLLLLLYCVNVKLCYQTFFHVDWLV